jgi:transaldolase
LIEENSKLTIEEISWLLYKDIIQKGAEIVLPIWQNSDHKYGYISAQVDPRFAFDDQIMLRQALELARLSPNIMIKIPGTREGYLVIEKLTEKGIGTNNTLAYSIPQFLTCMKAIRRGLERAKLRKVNLTKWRSVITHMSDRFGSLGDLKFQAETRNIELAPEEIRWAEIVILKKAYQLAEQNRYPGKMLICSMRIDKNMAGQKISCWHIEKLSGADIVYTCPPKFIKQLMENDDSIDKFNPKSYLEQPPRSTMKKLMKLPYFVQSYEAEGMEPEEFNRYAPLIATAKEFSSATRQLVDFVARQKEKH